LKALTKELNGTTIRRSRLKMDRLRGALELSKEDSESVSKIAVHSHRPHIELSFYEDFALRGIRVDRVEPGLVVCSFKVPHRLTVSQLLPDTSIIIVLGLICSFSFFLALKLFGDQEIDA